MVKFEAVEALQIIIHLAIIVDVMIAKDAKPTITKRGSVGYGKSVLIDLCQYVGVEYIRNPDNPECGYIACWDQHPYHMPCAAGLKVHRLFFWGSSYPCTEPDRYGRCDYVKNFLRGGRQWDEIVDVYQKGKVRSTPDSTAVAAKGNGRGHDVVHGAGEEMQRQTFIANIRGNRKSFETQSSNAIRQTGSMHDEDRPVVNNETPIQQAKHIISYPNKFGLLRPDYSPKNRLEESYEMHRKKAAVRETKIAPETDVDVELLLPSTPVQAGSTSHISTTSINGDVITSSASPDTTSETTSSPITQFAITEI